VDVVTLARYIVGLYDEATAAAVRMYADMDGDGIITNSDLVALARICVNIA
jgi:hypothetical protein